MRRIPLVFAVGLVAHGAAAQEFPKTQVAMTESGYRNIPNFRFDATHTAGGGWQITDTNWQHYAPMAGIDLVVRPNALSATEWEQGQVGGLMWAHEKCLPWGPYNEGLRKQVQVCAKPGHVATAANSSRPHPQVTVTPKPTVKAEVSTKSLDPFSAGDMDDAGPSFLISGK